MIEKIINIQRSNWQNSGKKLSANSNAKKTKGNKFLRMLEEEKAADIERKES